MTIEIKLSPEEVRTAILAYVGGKGIATRPLEEAKVMFQEGPQDWHSTYTDLEVVIRWTD